MPDALPLVSIVVPTWQQGRFLRATLESLVRQTYPRLEVLVHDNLSTDETPRILEEYAPRLARVVREKDAGQSDALRRGFAAARGEVLGWLNSDDLLMPDAVARAVAAIQADEPADLVYGHCAQVDEAGQFRGYYHDVQLVTPEALYNQGAFLCQPAAFFRHETYARAGGLDAALHFGLDWDLWCRMARAGARFRRVDEVWAAARLHPRAKSLGGGRRRLAEIWRINRRYKTTWLPRATLGYVYGNYLRARCPWLNRPLGVVWRFWTGGTVAAAVVEGVAPGGVLTREACRVRFPVFRKVRGARLVLETGNGARGPACRVALNGMPGETEPGNGSETTTWRFGEAQFFAAAELELRLAQPVSPGPRVRLREVRLDFGD